MRTETFEEMLETPILYMLVTNDRFELPLCVCESSGELARFLGFGSSTRAASRLSRASDGVVQTMDRRYKYLRLDPRTGEIYKGKLPPDVMGYCLSNGHKHRDGSTGRYVISEADGVEQRYLSVKDAAEKTGYKQSTIYGALRTGRAFKGRKWRYA